MNRFSVKMPKKAAEYRGGRALLACAVAVVLKAFRAGNFWLALPLLTAFIGE
jgi:hypothetical protein